MNPNDEQRMRQQRLAMTGDMKVNWFKMEDRIREILRDSGLDVGSLRETVIRIDECVAAYTGRGTAIPAEHRNWIKNRNALFYQGIMDEEWDRAEGKR